MKDPDILEIDQVWGHDRVNAHLQRAAYWNWITYGMARLRGGTWDEIADSARKIALELEGLIESGGRRRKKERK